MKLDESLDDDILDYEDIPLEVPIFKEQEIATVRNFFLGFFTSSTILMSLCIGYIYFCPHSKMNSKPKACPQCPPQLPPKIIIITPKEFQPRRYIGLPEIPLVPPPNILPKNLIDAENPTTLSY